ncbi:hypothetical protein [Quadrisphaera sp. DSM 44207]|uniref:hypothetical protein n=1 Tax=Quadrisphaera sp. DSM 44207 TaxID=1881057 RepID=UPI000881C10F|nr:hypothetical protein [Quadrisphaera sp. DSM 44207]SDQ71442.1 hypothetical protein SAMN05428996_2511 [Quadrisphaera sp. DSM 44207]
MNRALQLRDRAVDAGAAAARRAGERLLALPVWLQALAVYAATRAVTTAITLRVAREQPASSWTPASPGYGGFTAQLWDATWYQRIAETGYPLPLPRGDDGAPLQSEWAFFPAYPLLVRAAAAATGASWPVAAPTTSLLVGAVAAVVVLHLFRAAARRAQEPGADPSAAPRTALAGLALVLVFPSSPLLQYAYSESLALLALAGALLALVHRRYGWCAVAVLLLGASRAVAPPFAAVVAVHALARWRARGHDPFPVRERLAVALLAAASALAAAAWPAVVALATGRVDGYAQLQSAWRGQDATWVLPWVSGSRHVVGPVLGPVLLALAVASLVVWCTGRRARALGPELPAWVLAYAAHLLLVVDLWTSAPRFWLLAFPLALLLAAGLRSRGHLVTWLAASVALQVVWTAWLWRFSPPTDLPP